MSLGDAIALGLKAREGLGFGRNTDSGLRKVMDLITKPEARTEAMKKIGHMVGYFTGEKDVEALRKGVSYVTGNPDDSLLKKAVELFTGKRGWKETLFNEEKKSDIINDVQNAVASDVFAKEIGLKKNPCLDLNDATMFQDNKDRRIVEATDNGEIDVINDSRKYKPEMSIMATALVCRAPDFNEDIEINKEHLRQSDVILRDMVKNCPNSLKHLCASENHDLLEKAFPMVRKSDKEMDEAILQQIGRSVPEFMVDKFVAESDRVDYQVALYEGLKANADATRLEEIDNKIMSVREISALEMR